MDKTTGAGQATTVITALRTQPFGDWERKGSRKTINPGLSARSPLLGLGARRAAVKQLIGP